MLTGQKVLIVGGLLVSILGLCFGLVYTYLVDHQTLLVLKEDYQGAYVAAARRDSQGMQETLRETRRANYQNVRAIDVHTHLIKMASVVILVGLIFPFIRWPEGARKALAISLFAGAVVFPLGVFAEIFSDSIVPQAVAAGGALLAIASFAIILLGILHGIKDLSR